MSTLHLCGQVVCRLGNAFRPGLRQLRDPGEDGGRKETEEEEEGVPEKKLLVLKGFQKITKIIVVLQGFQKIQKIVFQGFQKIQKVIAQKAIRIFIFFVIIFIKSEPCARKDSTATAKKCSNSIF